jgi:hypothetical protein
MAPRLVEGVFVYASHAADVGRDVGYHEYRAVDSAELVAGEGQQGLHVVFVCDGIYLHEQRRELRGGDVGGEGGGEAEVVEVVDEDFEGGGGLVGEVEGGGFCFLLLFSISTWRFRGSSRKGLG